MTSDLSFAGSQRTPLPPHEPAVNYDDRISVAPVDCVRRRSALSVSSCGPWPSRRLDPMMRWWGAVLPSWWCSWSRTPRRHRGRPPPPPGWWWCWLYVDLSPRTLMQKLSGPGWSRERDNRPCNQQLQNRRFNLYGSRRRRGYSLQAQARRSASLPASQFIHRVKWRHISVVAIRWPFCRSRPSYCA